MRNIQSSVLFALPFIGYQPANISNGEPVLTAANIIKQTMLGPPFRWAWNRNNYSLPINFAGQDLLLAVNDFGWLEKPTLTDWNGDKKQLPVKDSLAEEAAIQRPQSIAVQQITQDGVYLRLNAIPDVVIDPNPLKSKLYTLSGFYQQAPVWMTSLASSWYPIPDHLAYICDWGLLAMLSLITKDIRSVMFMQKFVSHLLGHQDGITATQRNIFIGEWMALAGETQRNQLEVTQGAQARSTT